MEAFQKWVEECGGREKCAKRLGVTKYAVRKWELRIGWPKTEIILKIMRVSGLTFEEIIESTKPAGKRGVK